MVIQGNAQTRTHIRRFGRIKVPDLRATLTVHTNPCGTGASAYGAQQALKTERSNGALCAARNSTGPTRAWSVGHNSPKVGAARTSVHDNP